LSVSLGLMLGPAVNLMVPGILTLPVMEMLEKPRMVVTLAQDLLEEQEIELQKQEAVEEVVGEQGSLVGRATMFPKLGEENKLEEEAAEVELQKSQVEEVEMEDKKEKEDVNQMVEEERQMVEDESQMAEENERLVGHRTDQSLEVAKGKVEEQVDALMRFSKHVLMSALALMPRSLVLVWLDAPRDARVYFIICICNNYGHHLVFSKII